MPRRLLLSALCLLLLAVPAAARADAGTPLIWAGMLHLVVLNFFVGVLEGTVLAKLFRLPRLRTQGLLVPANYLSMIVGWLLLRAAWTPLERLLPGQAPLYKGAALMVILGVGSWAASVLLEWPFCALALRAEEQGAGRGDWRRSLRASVIAQTVSYALLVPFYLMVSPISLYTRARIEHSLAFVKPPLASVYYISPTDGAVWRVRTDGTGQTMVVNSHLRDRSARLFLHQNARSRLCDLGVVQEGDSPLGTPTYKTLLLDASSVCAPTPNENPGVERPDWGNFGQPIDLRPQDERSWTVFTDYWAGRGITVLHGNPSDFWAKQRVYTLAFETPFEQWFCRDATILPGDQVVFELGQDTGSDQIVILDMRTRQLGFLAMGQGPVVVMSPK